MNLPFDDNILLSLINTLLRDKYSSLAVLCEEEEISAAELSDRLAALGYIYDGELNKFKRK